MCPVLGWRASRAICCLLMLGLVSVWIVACDSSDSASGSRPTARATGIQNPSGTQGALAPISALPPGSAERPLLPGESGTAYMPNGMPALSPARGVNADQLFAETLKDEKQRFDRLERAVADMRREFDSIKPAIIRLSAVESDMQELVSQLQTLTGAPGADMPPQVGMESLPDIPMEPMAPDTAGDLAITETEPNARVVDSPIPSPPSAVPLQPEPAAATAHSSVPVVDETGPPPNVVATSTSPPPNNGDPNAVTGIRSGNHDGMSRLVLDISGPGDYTLDLDNTEHVLMIELPASTWGAASNGKFSKSPLLDSWSAKKSGKGSLVAVQLTGPATIAKQSKLAGANGTGSRVVIDLK